MQAAWIVGGVSAAAAAAGLAALVRTRWLQSRTLEKCVGISIAVHAVLAIVCVFVGGMSPASWGTRDEGRMTMQIVLSDEDDAPAIAEGGDLAPEPGAEPAVEPSPEDEPPRVATAAESPPADLVPLLEPPADMEAETEAAPGAPVTARPAPTA